MEKGKKKPRKHRLKQVLSVMLALSLLSSALVLAPAREVKAGPAAWVLDKLADTTVEICENAIIGAVGYAAEESDNKSLVQVVNVVDGLLGGSRGLEQECKEISAKLDNMNAELQQISQMNQQELAELYKLLEKTQRDSVDRYRNPIVNLYKNTYRPALDIYETYISKAKAYSEALTSGGDADAAKKAAKTAEQELIEQFKRLDFEDDIRTVKNNADDDGSQHLYLYQVDQYCRTVYPFEHQRFQMLESSINDVVLTLAYIGYMDRLYYDFYSAKAENDESIDMDLIESQTLRHLNDIIQTMNRISSQYANYNNDSNWGNKTDMLKMMRPYDVDTEYTFRYAGSERHTGYYENTWPESGTWEYPATARYTKETMPVSRVAIDGQNYLVVRQDLDLDGMRYWERNTIMGNILYFGFPNQDFYNVRETADGIYKLPSHVGDLRDFTKCDSFLSNQHIAKYLKQNGIGVNDNGAYVVLDSFTSPAERVNNPGLSSDCYTKYQWGTMSLIATTEVSTSDQTPNNLLTAILRQKGDEKEKHTIHAASSGSGSVRVTDLSGNDVNGTPVAAGTRLQIHVQADKGADLISLKAGSLKTFANREIMNMMEDENNACTFTWVMPYQDCTVSADFINVEGEGTEESPYLIASYEDLRELTEIARTESSYASAHYRVVADIDYGNQTLVFPVGGNQFKGKFDGGGYRLINANYSCLFGDIEQGALVKDIIMEISPYANGGLAGSNSGTIRNCHIYGDNSDNTRSPLAGINRKTGIIQDCSNTSPRKTAGGLQLGTDYQLGGIVDINEGKILNCFNGGKMEHSSSDHYCYLGGIAGYNYASGEILNCYNYGSIVSTYQNNPLGPIVGASDRQLSDSVYYLDSCVPSGSSHKGKPLDEGYMRSDEFMNRLNETALSNGWRRWERSDTVNNGYPYLAPLGIMRNLTLQAEHGSIAIKDMAGNDMTSPVEALTTLSVTVSAEEGYESSGLVLEHTGSQTTEDIALTLQPDGTSTASFTMPDEDCILTAQFIKTHVFPTDDDGTILIPDYETLRETAQAVSENPSKYAGASYRVTNDIINVQTPENFPDWPLSIGSEANPFTGNFDGGGFDIGGMKQDISATGEKYGGLFGAVGPDGVVHDVHIYAFNMTGGDAQTMGGIAGLNQGLIKDCSSGSAQTSGSHFGSDIDIDDMRNLNVTVTSHDGGGIAGESSGTILNCFSGADVTADASKGHAGGIAGITAQDSTVSNGYAMGKIKANQCGGIVGRSYSNIVNSYFCGSVEGETAGGVAGANHHTVEKTYSISSAEKLFGSGYGDAVSMDKAAMTAQTFADTLNKNVTGDMNYWAWDSKTHHGYPTLVKDPMIQRTLTDTDTGISITGTIHAGAVLDAEKLKEAHKLYEELARHVMKGEMLGVFDIKMQLSGSKTGQKTFTGSVQVTFPLAAEHKSKNIIILHKLSGGNVLMLEDVILKDSTASVQVKELSPFAVVAAEKDGINIKNTVKTGDSSNMLLPAILCIAAISVILGIILYRRRKHKHEKDC